MNICIVCDEYPPGPHGGLGTCARVLGRALVDAGHRVRVVGSYPAHYPGAERENDEGVEVWRLREPVHRLGWVRGRHAVFRRIASWAAAGEIDLVEVADWHGPAAGWPRLSVPVVARLNGSLGFFADELGRRPRRIEYWLERASLDRADAWCSASAYTAERTQKIFKLDRSAVAVLYNPVEPPIEAHDAAPPRSDCRVVFTGTLTEKKGVISLVRGWSRVLEAVPGAELHLFGKDGTAPDGRSMRVFLEALLPSSQAGTLVFHGHVPRERLFEAFRTARAAVFPSYAEAFGIAPFEAMIRGCATIYTKRLPGPELLRDQEDAILVDPDAPTEIADALIRLLRDESLVRALGARGRDRALTAFTTTALVPQNETFFREVIARFRARRAAGE